MRRLDPGQSWSLSIYLCRDWNNYYRIGYSPPGHPLSTSKKGEKYTWDKILSRRLTKMLNKVGPIHHDTGDIINFWTLLDRGMPSVMQLRFSDIVSLDADTFFIPLSLCFQSAIKVIGVCEYFDSMVKSDNSDLKWPLEDVKFRQDLCLSLRQIQMIWLKQSWPLLIGWSTLFWLLIGKSRKSSSLSGWCLCLEDRQCEPCDNQDFSHDEIQQPFVLSLSTPFLLFLETQVVCRFICSAVAHCPLLSSLGLI